MRSLTGKGAFITGGTSGIGLAIAEALAEKGVRLVLTYRRQDHLAEAQARLSGAIVQVLEVDVTDRPAVLRAATDAQRALGKIHLLVNSAGVNLLGPMDVATYEDWDWILGTNLGGVINTTIAVVPMIKEHREGGHVVNVGSMSCFIAGPASGIYAASKFAVRGLSEGLRLSLAPHGIGVSLVCPGLTKSNIFEASRFRPRKLAHSAFPLSSDSIERLRELHQAGMEPSEVAARTLTAILDGEFYVFSHPEFKYELEETFEEIRRCLPNGHAPEQRLVVERGRLKAKSDAVRILKAMTVAKDGAGTRTSEGAAE